MSQGTQCRFCVGFTPVPGLPTAKKLSPKKKVAEDNLLSSDEETKLQKKKTEKSAVSLNYWCEFFDDAENDWLCIHPTNKNMFSVEDVEKYRSFNYVLGIDNGLFFTANLLMYLFRNECFGFDWLVCKRFFDF